jgi:hypothetical protein
VRIEATRIDRIEATSTPHSADEIVKVAHHRAAAVPVCDDHHMVLATQRFREKTTNPFPPMQPAYVNAGRYTAKVKRPIRGKEEHFNNTVDKNAAWEELMSDIEELYQGGVGEEVVRSLATAAPCQLPGRVRPPARYASSEWMAQGAIVGF